MPLHTDLQERFQRSPRLCVLGKILDAIEKAEPDTHELMILAINETRREKDLPQHQRYWTASFLRATLNKNGYKIGGTSVKDHINQECACAKSA